MNPRSRLCAFCGGKGYRPAKPIALPCPYCRSTGIAFQSRYPQHLNADLIPPEHNLETTYLDGERP